MFGVFAVKTIAGRLHAHKNVGGASLHCSGKLGVANDVGPIKAVVELKLWLLLFNWLFVAIVFLVC